MQGYEIEVLKGAINTLRDVEAVLMEVSFLAYNKNAPLLVDTVQFMKEMGFLAYDICSLVRYRIDNTLVQADIIFLRKDSPWRSRHFNF